MKTIYLDAEYKCHLTDDGTMTEVRTEHFNNKCDAFIEGYRFVPEGSCWTREDGEVFEGVMLSPWKPYDEIHAAQCEYERELADIALILLGEEVV